MLRFSTIVALLISFIFVNADVQYDYGAIIDAGSTGSRLTVYKWAHRSLCPLSWIGPFSQPISQAGWLSKTNIPLASFKNHPQDVGQSLTPLLNAAKKILTGVDLSKTPIYLGATAGMRVLPQAQRDSIMSSVRTYLSSSGFLFVNESARIISGEEEGAFGWLTVNYINNDLDSATSLGGSVGALDLGGASTQITFWPNTDVMASLFQFRYRDHNVPLYTHSFLRYGFNYMLNRSLEALVPASTNKVINSPCYNVGFNFTYTSTQTASNYLVLGSGDASACQTLYTNTFGKSTYCPYDSCSINGEYSPPLPANMQFYAFSAFAEIVNDFNVSESVTLRSLQSLANTASQMSWTDLRVKYKGIQDQYLSVMAAGALYSVSLLHDGYGFDLDGTSLIFQSAVNGNDISWTLGAMLYFANQLPFGCDDVNTDRTYSVSDMSLLGGILSAVLVLTCCVFCLYAYKGGYSSSMSADDASLNARLRGGDKDASDEEHEYLKPHTSNDTRLQQPV